MDHFLHLGNMIGAPKNNAPASFGSRRCVASRGETIWRDKLSVVYCTGRAKKQMKFTVSKSLYQKHKSGLSTCQLPGRFCVMLPHQPPARSDSRWITTHYTGRMKRYALNDAARLLAVSPATLRRWLRSARLTPLPGTDARYKTISRAQLTALARVHGRVLISPASSPSDRLAALEQEVSSLVLRLDRLENVGSSQSPLV